MNREQRRKAGKGLNNERIDVTGLTVHFQNGQYVNLDTNKVQIIDKETGRPLFEEVLEPLPAQVSASETVEVHEDGIHRSPSQEFPEDEQSYSIKFDTPEGKMEYVKKGNWSGVRPLK